LQAWKKSPEEWPRSYLDFKLMGFSMTLLSFESYPYG